MYVSIIVQIYYNCDDFHSLCENRITIFIQLKSQPNIFCLIWKLIKITLYTMHPFLNKSLMVTFVILKAHEIRRVIVLLCYFVQYNLRNSYTIAISFITSLFKVFEINTF